MSTGPRHSGRPEDEVDLQMQVHALEWKVKDLARQNHELGTRLHEAEATIHAMYGSRGWRLLEALRRRGRGTR